MNNFDALVKMVYEQDDALMSDAEKIDLINERDVIGQIKRGEAERGYHDFVLSFDGKVWKYFFSPPFLTL